MQILKRSALGPQEFEGLRGFNFKPNQVAKAGEVIEISDLSEQVGLIQRGKVKPILPVTAVQIVLSKSSFCQAE